MKVRISIQPAELCTLLLGTPAEVAVVESTILDERIGMNVPYSSPDGSIEVEIQGGPSDIRRAIDAVDPNKDAPHCHGWFRGRRK